MPLRRCKIVGLLNKQIKIFTAYAGKIAVCLSRNNITTFIVFLELARNVLKAYSDRLPKQLPFSVPGMCLFHHQQIQPFASLRARFLFNLHPVISEPSIATPVIFVFPGPSIFRTGTLYTFKAHILLSVGILPSRVHG